MEVDNDLLLKMIKAIDDTTASFYFDDSEWEVFFKIRNELKK